MFLGALGAESNASNLFIWLTCGVGLVCGSKMEYDEKKSDLFESFEVLQ